jgi:hypothetical protein
VSAARKCDKPGCDKAIDPAREVYLSVVLQTPMTPDGLARDACSTECAHWLVDEHGEHVDR